MTEIRLSQLNYHPAQAKVVKERRRFNVVCCGRRFGKTVLGIDLATDVALDSAGPVGWFSPTYKMLADAWREATETLKPVIESMNSQERRIELLTGGSIEFWSLDNPDSARGRKYLRVIIDEAAMVAKLQEAWQNVIRPTLSDYQGDAWFFSTPKGAGFFKTIFDWGQDPYYSDWQSWQLPTSANPYIKSEEIEAANQQLPSDVFKQEYMAEFLETPGGVFRGVRAIATLGPKEPYAGRLVGGLDWARQYDYTVISLFDAATREQVYLDRFNKIDWALQRGRIRAIWEQWKPQLILAESNSIGGPNIEALQAEGLPVRPFDTTAQSKPQLIQNLALAIEKREITLLSDPVQLAELEAYEQTISPATGRASYNAPEGLHDDTVIATALAVWAMTNQGTINIIDSATRQPAGASTGLADDLFNWLEKGAS